MKKPARECMFVTTTRTDTPQRYLLPPRGSRFRTVNGSNPHVEKWTGIRDRVHWRSCGERFARRDSMDGSYREVREMGTSANAERRNVPRRPFRGTVELALPNDREGYEADAVDLSVGGMALRTSLLPDKGSELECRFALEGGKRITARGEVVWAQDAGSDAGEFGLRFLDLDARIESAIRESFRSERRDEIVPPASTEPVRARLHIPGMGAPLRASVRTDMDDVIVLGSDLSFLKLGEPVEIERGGVRSGGTFEDVTVEVDPITRVARLVLTVALASARSAAQPQTENNITCRTYVVPPPNSGPEAIPSRPSRRPAQATAVLTPDLRADSGLHDDADLRGARALVSENDADAISSAAPGSGQPPRWLVAMLAACAHDGQSDRHDRWPDDPRDAETDRRPGRRALRNVSRGPRSAGSEGICCAGATQATAPHGRRLCACPTTLRNVRDGGAWRSGHRASRSPRAVVTRSRTRPGRRRLRWPRPCRRPLPRQQRLHRANPPKLRRHRPPRKRNPRLQLPSRRTRPRTLRPRRRHGECRPISSLRLARVAPKHRRFSSPPTARDAPAVASMPGAATHPLVAGGRTPGPRCGERRPFLAIRAFTLERSCGFAWTGRSRPSRVARGRVTPSSFA